MRAVGKAVTWWLDGVSADMPERLARLLRPKAPVRITIDDHGIKLTHDALGDAPIVLNADLRLARPLKRLLEQVGARLAYPADKVHLGRFEVPELGDVDPNEVAAANMAMWTPFAIADVIFAAKAKRYTERTFLDCAVVPRRDLDTVLERLGPLRDYIQDVDLGPGCATLPDRQAHGSFLIRTATRTLTASALFLAVAVMVVFIRDIDADREKLRSALARSRPDVARISAIQADLAALDRWRREQSAVLTAPAALDFELLSSLATHLPETASLRRLVLQSDPRLEVLIELTGDETREWQPGERYRIVERRQAGPPSMPVTTYLLVRRSGS